MRLICKECPNGCALRLERTDEATVLVHGNRCSRGVAHARAVNTAAWPGQYLPADRPARYSSETLAAVLEQWGLRLDRVETGTAVQGSPERSAFRTVVTDDQGRHYLLETLSPHDVARRRLIAAQLRGLCAKGLPVIPYETGLNGETVQRVADKEWMLSAYVESETLDRATYWQEGWRGEALADFLCDLSASTRDAAWSGGPAFSLPAYIDRLLQTVRIRRPQLLDELGDLVVLLRRELYPVYDAVPQRFSHGDPHPMNVLWSKDGIRAVIDWEFSGLRPLVYDAALVIGCVGAEAPGALDGGFLEAFRRRLDERAAFAPEHARLLPLFTLAQRFAWLSEWLRHSDGEMIAFECFFMNLLRQRLETSGEAAGRPAKGDTP